MSSGRFESPWPQGGSADYAESSAGSESPALEYELGRSTSAYPSIMPDTRGGWNNHSHPPSTRALSPFENWPGRSSSRQPARSQSRTPSSSHSSSFDSHSRSGNWSGGSFDWESQCKQLKDENLILNGEVTTWRYVPVYYGINIVLI